MKRISQLALTPLMLVTGTLLMVWGLSQLWQPQKVDAACAITPGCVGWSITWFGCDSLEKCTCGFNQLPFTCYREDGVCNATGTIVLFRKCYQGTCNCNCPEPDGGCGEDYHWSSTTCKCIRNSPIIIDVDGDGFDLTNAANGVDFNFSGDGFQRLSWTAPGSDDAFLTLPHNGNVASGFELFGNLTHQPETPNPNGFLALAEYDKPEQGGNSDGVIDAGDQVFSLLRLWQDTNHNGVSEEEELHTLPELDVESISLNFKKSKKTDAHGNEFSFRAKVEGGRHSRTGRWAWDVFFVSAP